LLALSISLFACSRILAISCSVARSIRRFSAWASRLAFSLFVRALHPNLRRAIQPQLALPKPDPDLPALFAVPALLLHFATEVPHVLAFQTSDEGKTRRQGKSEDLQTSITPAQDNSAKAQANLGSMWRTY